MLPVLARTLQKKILSRLPGNLMLLWMQEANEINKNNTKDYFYKGEDFLRLCFPGSGTLAI